MTDYTYALAFIGMSILCAGTMIWWSIDNIYEHMRIVFPIPSSQDAVASQAEANVEAQAHVPATDAISTT